MAEHWGILAQVKSVAAVLTNVYTAPLSRRATVLVVICNVGAPANVRLAYAVGGAADNVSQYLLYDFSLGANAAVSTEKFTISESDVLRVYSDSGDVVFNVNGIEEYVT